MNLPSSWFAFTDHTTTYRVDPTPTMIAVSVAGAVVVLFVVLVVVAWRKPGAFVVPIVPALLGVIVGSATFVTLDYFATVKHPSVVPETGVIFAQVIRLNHAAFAIGIGAALGGVLVVAFRTKGHLALLPLALPLLFAGVGLFKARQYASSVRDLGYLPYFDLANGGVMHAGRDHEVPVRLMSHFSRRSFLVVFSQTVIEPSAYPVDSDEYAKWNATRSVHVAAPAPGAVPLVAQAHRGPVSFTTKLEGKAVPEVASPFFSLRVGNEFHYRVRRARSEGRLLFFVPIGGGAREDELVITVTGAHERPLVRTFTIEVRQDDHLRGFEVVALDGEMRAYDAEHETIGAPMIASPFEDLAIRRYEPCTFSLVGAGLAECQRGGYPADVPGAPIDVAALVRARYRHLRYPQLAAALVPRGELRAPPEAFALAAPANFVRSKHDTGGTIVTGLVALFTLGIVIPPNSSETSSYTLVATRPGPEGSPEAPGPR